MQDVISRGGVSVGAVGAIAHTVFEKFPLSLGFALTVLKESRLPRNEMTLHPYFRIPNSILVCC